jgi:hypothetical protein
MFRSYPGGRLKTRATSAAYQGPLPARVGMPRSLRAAAMPLTLVTPDAHSSAMTGATSAARLLARVLRASTAARSAASGKGLTLALRSFAMRATVKKESPHLWRGGFRPRWHGGRVGGCEPRTRTTHGARLGPRLAVRRRRARCGGSGRLRPVLPLDGRGSRGAIAVSPIASTAAAPEWPSKHEIHRSPRTQSRERTKRSEVQSQEKMQDQDA